MSGAFSISGLSSGIDTEGLVKKLMDIEKKPLTTLQNDQKKINTKLPIMQGINYKLLELKTMASDLTYETPFMTKKVSSGSTSVTASVTGVNVASGTYTIDKVSKIATATATNFTGTVGGFIDPDEKLSTAMKRSIETGNFSINNHSFYINSSSTSLNDIISTINSAQSTTGVVASYDSANDKLVLQNATAGNKNSIILGNSADTSDFLSIVGLASAYQDSSSGVTKLSSTGHLGAVDTSKKIEEIKFDRTFAAGKIKINGIEIDVNSADTINDVISRINKSDAGVTASYDSTADKLQFTSKNNGASYIKLEEVSGGSNFLELVGAIGVKSSNSISKTAGSVGLTDTLGSANLKTAVTPGTMKITHAGGSVDINYDSTTTIQSVIDTINNAGINATASYDSASGKFYIKPSANSDPNLTITDVSGNLSSVLNFSGAGANQNIGSNAEYVINGVTNYSNSNTIVDKFSGITFTLNGTSTDRVSLVVTNDSSKAKENIENFVKKYNEILTEVDKELKDEAGSLYKDSTLEDIMDEMRRSVNKYISNGTNIKSLSDIGITTGKLGMQFTSDYIGKLEIDSDTLTKALESNPNDVRKLFAYDPNGGSSYADGVASSFSSYLNSLTKTDGTINKVIEISNKELTRVTTSISDWNTRLKEIEEGLNAKFKSMEVLMGQLKRQSESLSASLSQLSSSSS